MLHSSNRKFRINCLLLAAIAPLSMQLAYANGLAVTGDSVTISASAGGFSQAKSLTTSPGLIPSTSNIPAASISSDLTFAFNLAAATGKTITTGSPYTFQAGMFIDDDATNRRLEISISNISITFDANGNIVSGSVAAGSNAIVSGRSADGNITANITMANTLLSFSDTSLLIRAGAQISEIQTSPSAILQDLTTTFTAAAAYKYGIFLKQTGGPVGVTLGLTNGTTFFGCPSTNPMLLAGQTNFINAYALQGAMGVAGAAGTDPVPFATGTANCVTSPALGGGGGGGSSTAATDATINTTVTSLTNQLASSGTPTAAVVTAVTTFATDSIAQVAAGTASPAAALGVLDTLNTLLSKQSFTSVGGNTGVTNSLNVLDLLNSTLTALQGKTLTATEKTSFISKVANMATSLNTSLNNAGNATDAATSIAPALLKLGQSISSAAAVLNSGVIPNAHFLAATDLSKDVSEIQSFTNLVASISFTLAKVSLNRVASVIQNTTPILQPGSDTDSGVSYLSATVINSLNPSETKVDKGTGTLFTAQASLLNAINITGTTANYDASSGLVDIVSGSTYLPTYLVETALITTNFQAGVITSANGSAIAVNGGIGSTLVPAPRDRGGLISVLEKAGISVVFEADGSLNLTPATGDRLTGVFGFDDVDTGTLGTAAVTFTLPTGNPKSTSYVITAKYSDGSSQKIQPYVAANSFYDSLQALNVNVTTNRSTGVISGPNNLSLRPDYFVKSVNASDTTFHASKKDSFGIAYRQTTDFNADGKLDVEVITATDKQVLYVLP